MQDSEAEKVPSLARPALPPNRLSYSISAGIIAGLLIALINVAVTLLNADTFNTAAHQGNAITVATATAVVGLAGLSLLITLIICLIMGFIVGRIAVRRLFGFIAGAIAGVVLYLLSFVVRYIPGYPGSYTASSIATFGAIGAGILISLIFLAIWAIIGGLIALLGTWLATRRHPYYMPEPS